MKILNQYIRSKTLEIFVILGALCMFFVSLSMSAMIFFTVLGQIWDNLLIIVKYASWLFVGSILSFFYLLAFGIVANGFKKR